MKIYICEEWTVPKYDFYLVGELPKEMLDKCKQAEVTMATCKRLVSRRNRWRETEDKLAGVFRPGLMK